MKNSSNAEKSTVVPQTAIPKDSSVSADLSPLAKEQRPVSRLADRIVSAVYRCIHELEDDETDGRRNPNWWLDNLKAKTMVVRLLGQAYPSITPFLAAQPAITSRPAVTDPWCDD